MKITRAVTTGIIVWILIFSTFSLLILFPLTQSNLILQGIIVGIAMVPFTILGTKYYYKNGANTNGFSLGLVVISTALILDVFITVPFVEIPSGGSYASFFTNPILWILVVENVVTVWAYWKVKITPIMTAVEMN